MISPGCTSEINAEHSDAALKWYRGFKEAILSLEEQPNRCPVTPESDKLRHLLYGNKPHIYRAIYRVLEKQKQVEVLHIRHGARRRFKGADITSETKCESMRHRVLMEWARPWLWAAWWVLTVVGVVTSLLPGMWRLRCTGACWRLTLDRL